MGADGIFLIRDGRLALLEQCPYDSEAILQDALASFPEVLAGSSTTDSGTSSRLLLIRREMGVPATEGAGATWSLDHLFVSSDGVPVLVEVKRSSDTRLRREVMGQMLDYAANAVRYWPPSELRATFEATALDDGTTGDERLRETVPGVEPDEFWEHVEENLKTGRIRMVFVADRLPTELVRIIEFLNEQMNPAEVLGVEVVQYVGDGQQVLVPRLVGRTSSAVAAKQSGRTTWDEENFLVAVADRHGENVAAFFQRLFDYTRSRSGQLAWSGYVSGRHMLGGVSTVVWTADPGVASAKARAYLYLYLPEIRNRVDYAISSNRFHWESQNVTTTTSPTGRRYLSHHEGGSHVVLFVRDAPTDDLGAVPFLCLGQADYVDHRGERPIAITWRLRRPMPADTFAAASAVAQ